MCDKRDNRPVMGRMGALSIYGYKGAIVTIVTKQFYQAG